MDRKGRRGEGICQTNVKLLPMCVNQLDNRTALQRLTVVLLLLRQMPVLPVLINKAQFSCYSVPRIFPRCSHDKANLLDYNVAGFLNATCSSSDSTNSVECTERIWSLYHCMK